MNRGALCRVTETKLYRHFSQTGELLYVGVSLSVMARLSKHMGASGWADQIAKVEIATYPTREAALDAERDAIRVHKPRYNVKLVVPDRDMGFPEGMELSRYDDDGTPVLASRIEDVEGDPLHVTFNPDGTAWIDCDRYSYIALDLDALSEIKRKATIAKAWYGDWWETDDGKAYLRLNG